MRILLTGSSGRVGSAIAQILLRDNHEILGLDLVPGRYTTRVGSVADRQTVFSCVRDIDAVIHVAALHVPDLGRASDHQFMSVNVHGTANLLEAAVSSGVRTFIYSSTTSVYGAAMIPTGRAVWVTEELMPKPRDIYDRTKLEAETLCRDASGSAGMSCVSLRFSRCFPEADDLMAIYRLYRGVDIRDVAAAHVRALDARFSRFEVFNISARTPFLQSDCEHLLGDARSVLQARCPGIEKAFAVRGWSLPVSIDRVYSIKKAEGGLKYDPKYNFWKLIGGA